tara:strand:- start:1917 stop:2657 length:741 start_codon:yes stop_codon:yes gene_type:complete
MSLEIIGAGFGRTGTLSTFTALKELGFPCYHMTEVLLNKENKSHIDFWNKVANSPAGEQHNWEVVFKNYTAAVDNPACCVWKELTKAYPEAKVLLTIHPKGPEAWYESTISTIYFTERMWQFKVMQAFIPFMTKFGNMSKKLVWNRSHAGTMSDKNAAIAHYNQHIENLKASVTPEKLLIFNVKDGWEPLCRFLNKPIPDLPFPNVNDRAEIKKTLAGLTRGAYVIVGIGIILLLLLIYTVYTLLT